MYTYCLVEKKVNNGFGGYWISFICTAKTAQKYKILKKIKANSIEEARNQNRRS